MQETLSVNAGSGEGRKLSKLALDKNVYLRMFVE